MKFNDKKFTAHASIALLAAYLLTFIVYYLANYIIGGVALTYVWLFLQKATYLLLPIAASVIVFTESAFLGIKRALISAIALSMTRMIYFIPYYYLIFILDGFDSVESISYGALVSLGEAIIAYGLTVAVFFVMRAVFKKRSGGKIPCASLICKPTRLDISEPVAASFIFISLAAFAYLFIIEIADTVSFIIEYSGRFSSTEIVYTVVSYVFDIAMFAIYFTVMSNVKNFIIRKRVSENV
jgi:hypothetical protein